MIAGIELCFFGRKLFKFSVLLVTSNIIVSGLLFLFYETILYEDYDLWIGWTSVICSVMIGLVSGSFMMKLDRVGCGVVAGWSGFVFGLVLNEACFDFFNHEILFWFLNIFLALLNCILSYFYYDHVFINSTAGSGAFLIVRGVSLYAGGYPNMFTLVEELDAGNLDDFSDWFYVYLAFMVLVAVLGSIIQYKINKPNEKGNLLSSSYK